MTLSMTEQDIHRRHMLRFLAFLRAELEDVPTDHPLHRRYADQAARVEKLLGLKVVA